jgi:hypothetical protein
VHEKDADGDEAAASKLADHFPDFLWVLRDFVLQLTDEVHTTFVTLL